MKKILLLGSLCLSLSAFAQEPEMKDDLNTSKDSIRNQLFPAGNGQLLYSNYHIAPADFLLIAEKLRRDIYEVIQTGGGSEQELKRKDADMYVLNLIATYKSMYGMDSTEAMKLLALMMAPKDSSDFEKRISEVIAKMRTKQLSPAQTQQLDSIVFFNSLPDDELLFRRSRSYRGWVDSYLKYKHATRYKADTGFKAINGTIPLHVILNEIQNPFIREYLCYRQAIQSLKLIKDTVKLLQAYNDFNKVLTAPYYKDQIKKLYNNYKFLNTPGLPSPVFNYPDITGKMVSLKSLKGKYVYIDIWATWCGPCKAEIPFLQKIEHEYEGKNIHFVSISVDRITDKAKWQSYVRENKLGGLQLLADKDLSSSFITGFYITSIPRFILIDPNGKIVSADAHRPSNPLLRQQLNQLLNK